MSLLGLFGKKSKQDLLFWQKLVLKNSPNRLIMTEKQLKETTLQLAKRELEIANDCIRIINTTVKPDVFFMRLQLLLDAANNLCTFEKYVSFTGTKPSDAFSQALDQYQDAIRDFLARYFWDMHVKAEGMKTDKGKLGKYQKFYDSLQEYYRFMDESNIDFIETKYRAYTRQLLK